MNLAILNLPDGLTAASLETATPVVEGADLVLTGEMPFGSWLAAGIVPDVSVADASIDSHVAGFSALARCYPQAGIVTSAPRRVKGGLINEAVLLHDGAETPLHVKTRLPEEAGWYEQRWFKPGGTPPRVMTHKGLRFAVLLCSELMYTELARDLLVEKVEVILVPRATGGSVDHWLVAARMAAIWTGAYVLSANRVAADGSFNGAGFAVAPDGSVIGVSSENVLTVEIDRELIAENRLRYPCIMECPVPSQSQER